MEKLLFESSIQGNVTDLIMLLQEDPLIIDKVTLNSSGDTPLHVASMLGHVNFVMEIVIRKPYLVMETNSERRLPLHIASAKGHVELVRFFLSAIRSSEACLARDSDGRNPLHLAATKGRLEVVKLLVQAQPEAARAMVQHDTILHLCVLHNQPEIIKFLIETDGDHEFVNSKDSYGNNILHLAVVHRQIETINLLLLNTSVEVNASNTNGETPMDILAQGPRDLKYKQILRSLISAGAVEAQISGIQISLDRLENNTKQAMVSPLKIKESPRNYDNWLDTKRNSLMVVASLIATMAFQAGTNPPGGFWQDNSPTDSHHQPGYAVMVSNAPNTYQAFLVCSTVGYVSSLTIILLLISGLPFLKHVLVMWILSVIMWIAITSMSLTYLISILIWLPQDKPDEIGTVATFMVFGWMGLMSLIVVSHIIRLIVIIVRLTVPLIAIAMKVFRRLLFL
ncbi:hypothetical protein LXL04_034988 [Taraxacum kok-saghyz]